MLILPPIRRRRRTKRVPVPPPAPAGLTLLSAVYDNVGLTLTLGFDRAIDISGYQQASIEVDDGTYTSSSYLCGRDAELVDAQTVEVSLDRMQDDTDPGVFLTAQSNTGIVAVDGSGEWAGVNELALPFG